MVNLVYHSPSTASTHSPFDAAILNITRSGSLCIVSPYIDVAYLARVVARADQWRLLSDVEQWLSSLSLMARPSAWQFIRAHVDRIHHCPSVHAKVVIGCTSAIIGSANLTRSGLLRRHEMAVVIDDQSLVDELAEWFEALWRETTAPSVDETNAFVQWLNEVAAKGTTERQRFVLSSPARRVRARLVEEAHEQDASPSLEPARTFDLTEAAKNVVVDLQAHYESVGAAVDAMLERWPRSALTLFEAVREVRRVFPEARVREIYLLLIQDCANHPRSVFVETTENRFVLKDGRFVRASRDDVIAAVAPFDAFLCYLIQVLTFGRARAIPAESAVEEATGFGGVMQVLLVEELNAAGVLLMEDAPGELPKYSLEPDFDWDGRYRLFSRSASVWSARKASAAPLRAVTDTGDIDAVPTGRYGRDAPSVLDQIWRPVRAMPAVRVKSSSRPATVDYVLSRLLKVLFTGESLEASSADELKALISTRLEIPAEMVAAILDRTSGVPAVVHRVDGEPGKCRVEIDPSLTWDALAAFPRTQHLCERFLRSQ